MKRHVVATVILAGLLAAPFAAHAQTVTATPENGNADAGVASRPIANVAANDTVNGSPATLGSGGNAVLSQVGTWPDGIALTPSTGAISTKISVQAGTYPVQYQICDKTNSSNCASATDVVTVVNAVIVANPDSGTANAGTGSRAIQNVASNDTINGNPVVLGSGGNGTVSAVGSWPSGLTLSTSTGAISTSTALVAGTYSVQYQLCDTNVPKVCSTTTDTVTVINASVVANPDSGTADSGIASRPIANVAVNDTINGAQVRLGAGGNGTVSQVGTWPAGIALTPSTGAVSTTVAVQPGSYTFSYQLCDRNTPAQCVTAVDTVTVFNTSISAVPESGTARVGVASKPILNVAANDTVNGSAAILGSGGNATVAQSGTWPAGIVLTPSTGAITTAVSVPAQTYNVDYKLCDRNVPANCTTTTDTISVVAAMVALPVSGSSFVGRSAVAIGNVTVKDSVNGAAVTLGSGANATVSQAGAWPDGISLNPANGAISVTAAVAEGTYPVQYTLCDLNSPPNCATSTANVIVTPIFPETQASSVVLGDIEFDSGRDGLSCPQCNDGQGNMRFNWTDRNNNLWVSSLDPNTGLFVPPGGHQVLVDNSAFFWQTFGNGPEWAYYTPPGAQNPVSALVYTRFTPGTSPTYLNAGAALATAANGVWTPSFFPNSAGPGNNTILPVPSQCNSDPVAYAVYANLSQGGRSYTEAVSSDPNTEPVLTDFGNIANQIGERWVACTSWLTFQGTAPIGNTTIQQIFWYDNSTGALDQVTFDATPKSRGLMFKAPEFLGLPYPYMLITVASNNILQVYQQTGQLADGAPVFTLYNSIYSPDPTEPFFFAPKVFVHCTPDCHTYVAVGMSRVAGSQFTQTQTNGLGVTNVDPLNPMFKVLVQGSSQPQAQRLDPEYFITPNGPFVYYAYLTVRNSVQSYQELGFYFIDMKLGPPSGPCVGSSAEGGLKGPVGTCQ